MTFFAFSLLLIDSIHSLENGRQKEIITKAIFFSPNISFLLYTHKFSTFMLVVFMIFLSSFFLLCARHRMKNCWWIIKSHDCSFLHLIRSFLRFSAPHFSLKVDIAMNFRKRKISAYKNFGLIENLNIFANRAHKLRNQKGIETIF